MVIIKNQKYDIFVRIAIMIAVLNLILGGTLSFFIALQRAEQRFCTRYVDAQHSLALLRSHVPFF